MILAVDLTTGETKEFKEVGEILHPFVEAETISTQEWIQALKEAFDLGEIKAKELPYSID